MHRFYVEQRAIQNDIIVIEGSDVNHIKNVLRLTSGDDVVVCDGNGLDYYCIVKEMSKEQVLVSIKEKVECKAELELKIYLFQIIIIFLFFYLIIYKKHMSNMNFLLSTKYKSRLI